MISRKVYLRFIAFSLLKTQSNKSLQNRLPAYAAPTAASFGLWVFANGELTPN